mgnify:FL=1
MVNVIFAAAAMLGMLLGGPMVDKVEQPQLESAIRCPAVYAPVICDNGKIYPNLCEADKHHATVCVPYLPEF